MALKYWVRVNGNDWMADPTADPANDVGGVSLAVFEGMSLFPVVQGAWATLTANFGASPFAFAVPDGFTGWPDGAGGWNTLDPTKISVPSGSLQPGNLTFDTGGASCAVQAVRGDTAGFFYFEVRCDSLTEIFAANVGAGISRQYPGINLTSYFNGRYSGSDPNGGVLNKSLQTGNPFPVTIPSILMSCGTVLDSDLFSYMQGDTLCFAIALTPIPTPPEILLALLNVPELQFCDANGNPYADGTVDLYVLGTSTPKDSWIDPEGDALNTKPIVLDSAGRCIIWGDGDYRVVLRDAVGNLVYDQPSSTLVSAAMVPVVRAPTLADARNLLGITDAIEVETDRALAAEAALSAALGAEITVRETNVADLQAALEAEAEERILQDAALQAEIDALAPASTSVVGGVSMADGTGHRRVTFDTPFATSCNSVVATMRYSGFGSNTLQVANLDRYGFDCWITQAGSPIPKPFEPFFWMATGS